MSPLATALGSVGTVAAFLVTHYAAIKKEYVMVRTEIATFIASAERLEAAIATRLAQPSPLTAEETAALADATAKADAATAAVSSPVVTP